MSAIPSSLLFQTEAYLYVKHNNKITEYKVVNRGDVFNPVMHKVQFKDTQTNIIRRHIPFYEETGTLYFVYSNIQLTDAQFEDFTPTEYNEPFFKTSKTSFLIPPFYDTDGNSFSPLESKLFIA